MIAVIKCAFYGFIAFMVVMVISGVKEYQKPAKSVDELFNFDSSTVYEQIDDFHKPNPNSTVYKLCNRQ